MTGSKLVDLPADAFDVICELLDGTDVASLLGVGLSALRHKVSTAARNLHCKRTRFSGFPFSLFKLPQLRSLDVSIVKHQYGDYPLRLENNLPLPTSPVGTLTSLRLSFAQSFRVLDESAPDLNDLFPTLTELHLTEARTVWRNDHLSKLPQTLRKLSLLNCEAFREVPEYSYSTRYRPHELDLTLLPESLEELSLSAFCIGEHFDWPSFEWPSGLRKLVFLSFDDSDEILYRLPDTLEHLEIEFVEGYDVDDTEVLVPLSNLPRSLRVFKMNSRVYKVDLEASPLPPYIEEWDARTNWESLMAGKNQEEVEVEAVMRAYLPPTLKRVGLGSQDEHYRVCRDQFPAPYSVLPLQSLNWHRFPFAPTTILPGTLKHLECVLETEDQAMLLPTTSLTSLQLTVLHVPLPLQTWSHLTSHLHKLVLCTAPHTDTKELLTTLFKFDGANRSLPLTHLELLYPEGFVKDIAMYLPTNLTTLRLAVPSEAEDETVNATIAQMSYVLPKLGALGILYYPREEKAAKQLDVISHCPRSLNSLEISFRHATVNPERMRYLPPNLRELEMRCVGNPAGLTNEHFAHLPKSLTKISLISIIQETNAEFWAQLPPNIHTINIQPRGSGFYEPRKSYYTAPQWENCFGDE